MAKLKENIQFEESTTIPIPKMPKVKPSVVPEALPEAPQAPLATPEPKRDLSRERAIRQASRAKLFGGVATVLSNFGKALPPRSRSLSRRSLRINSLPLPSGIQGDNIQMFKSYGAITTRFGGGTPLTGNHRAIDIAAGYGTPIRAFYPGRVVEVVTGKRKGDKGYGNYVKIQDKFGNVHYYSHLSNSWVQVGDQVEAKESLGAEGNSGQTFSAYGGSGSHLHYEIRNALGKRINPETFSFGG